MGLSLVGLDEITRPFMLEEMALDVSEERTYISSRLNPHGVAAFLSLLREAATNHDDSWLAQELRFGNLFNLTYPRRKPKGGYTDVQMPVNAPDTLAEGEFNRFYIRGLSRRAIDKGIPALEVYRARHSMNPRPESEARIGAMISATHLLNDLRINVGGDTALGVPGGVNSGLSVKIPRV